MNMNNSVVLAKITKQSNERPIPHNFGVTLAVNPKMNKKIPFIVVDSKLLKQTINPYSVYSGRGVFKQVTKSPLKSV